MSTFAVVCPNCKTGMDAQDEWIGMNAECPSCQTEFLIKQEQTPQSTDLRVKLNHKKTPPTKFLVGKSAEGVKLNQKKVQHTNTEPIPDRIFYTPPERRENTPDTSLATDSTSEETQCPKCYENIPQAAIFCPFCNSAVKSFENEDVDNEASQEMAGNGLKADEKYCPKCGEVIKRAAVYCRFCNSDLQNVSKPRAITTGYSPRGMAHPMARMSPVSYNSNSSSQKSTAGLILGILSLILWLLPIVGIPVAIAGLIVGVIKNYTLGIVLSGIGLILGIINSVIGAMMWS